MPGRERSLLIGETYHVFNKVFDSNITFRTREKNIFLKIIEYYRTAYVNIPKFSNFNKLSSDYKRMYLEKIFSPQNFNVSIYCYCIMPTHYHLLLQQLKEGGISKFMSQIQNSFTRYFNIKNKRKGPLFLPRFKAKYIGDDNTLKHVSRYIHLNPFSSNMVNTKEDLINYNWSSFIEYVKNESICDTRKVLELFTGNKLSYENFVLNNKEYQKTLEKVKYTNKW